MIYNAEMNWDWTAFWTGAGALAAIATVAASVVRYIRGRSRVVVQVVNYQHWLPQSARQLFKHLDDAWYELKDPDSLKSADPYIQRLLNSLTELSKDRPLVDFLKYEYGIIWVFNVTNRGNERAEKLELQVPDAIHSMLVKSDGTHEVFASGIIHIPELRPRESVRIMSCAKHSIGAPQLLQASGKATIRFQELVDSRNQKLLYLSSIVTALFLLGLAILPMIKR